MSATYSDAVPCYSALMSNVKYIGKAHKVSPPGGKTSLWELRVYRVSDNELVATSKTQLFNNEYTVDKAIAKATAKAQAYKD